jgi:hypothetical protein
MIKKESYDQKIQKHIENVSLHIKAKAEKAWQSGAVNPDNYEDNFCLPNIVMHAILQDVAHEYIPVNAVHIAESNNIGRFI